jgi:hypothetical protein
VLSLDKFSISRREKGPAYILQAKHGKSKIDDTGMEEGSLLYPRIRYFPFHIFIHPLH